MRTERKCSQSALAAKEEGNTLFSSGDYEAAIIKYKKAISIDPSNPAFYTNICNCCKKLGKFEEMERYARLCVERDALKIDPNQKDIKKLYDETKKKLDDEALTDLMKQLKAPNGKSVWVSENLANHKSEFMSPEGSIDLNKILELDSTRRGVCANPDCRADENSLGIKMMRCSRCWQVDYCNRDCQRADWKRHKKQCRKSGGWQSLIYEGKQAMKKKDFTRAIELFLKVLDTKKEITASLTIISECFL